MTVALFQQLPVSGGGECRPVHGLVSMSSVDLSCKSP
jgi:hypothetical protein